MLKSILDRLNDQPLFPDLDQPQSSPRALRYYLISGGSLIILCTFLAWLRWGQLGTFWDDRGRWLYEAYRFAEGEMMYRDFSWQYPPFSLFVFGVAFRIFESTFLVAQLLLDGLSVILVLLIWLVARNLFPERLALLVAAAVAIVGITYEGVFALFSLQLYTPALLTGCIGMLLMLLGIVRYLRDETKTPSTWFLLALGCTVCLLSKPEFMLGSLGSLAVLALADTQLRFKDLPWRAWFLHYALVFIVTVLPAAVSYGFLIRTVGFENLVAGVTAYGVATIFCPWWPTGLGLLSVAAALAEGFFVIALLMITLGHPFFGRRDPIVLRVMKLGLIPSFVLVALYWMIVLDTTKRPIVVLFDLANRLTSTFEGLLPAMWWSIALWIFLVIHSVKHILQHRRVGRNLIHYTVMLTPFILISARGLFNGPLSETSHIPAVATPFWAIVAPYLLFLCLHAPSLPSDAHPKPRPRISGLATLVCLVMAYVAVRIVIGLVVARDISYTPLQTEAGLVQVSDQGLSANVYAYVTSNTRPDDYILDINHGGGIYVAARRRSPIFSTQFDYFQPSEHTMARDLALLKKHRPALVIGDDKPNLGTLYGTPSYTCCVFPRIPWRSDRPCFDLDKILPIVVSVQSEYHPRSRIGHFVMYERN